MKFGLIAPQKTTWCCQTPFCQVHLKVNAKAIFKGHFITPIISKAKLTWSGGHGSTLSFWLGRVPWGGA